MNQSSMGSQVSPDAGIIMRILSPIADHEQCDVIDLPPLYDVVDLDMLQQAAKATNDIELSFSYQDYRVSIEEDGHVCVIPEND